MGKVKTSSIFYRRGVPNINNGFATSVNGNWSIVQPTFLFNTPTRNAIIPINPVVTPELIKSGQVLLLDSGNQNSYSGSGILWRNLGSGGSSYDTTLFNSPSFTNNGLSSYFLFNGTDQYGDLVRPVQDSFSLCILFNTTQFAGDPDAAAWYSNQNPQILGGDVNGTSNDYGISIGIGTIFFGTGNSSVPIDVTIKSISNAFNDGNWHYLVATKNKTTNKN